MEHRDIIANRSIENKYILLNHRNQIVQRFGIHISDFLIIISDFTCVIAVARHQQIEQRGFAAAGRADDRVFPARFKGAAHAAQNIAARFIAEAYIVYRDSFDQLIRNARARPAHVVVQRQRKLIHQRCRRLLRCQLLRQFADGDDHIGGQIDKHHQHARRNAMTGQREIRARQKRTQLRGDARHAAQRADHRKQLAPIALRPFNGGVASGKQTEDGIFRLEAFDHRKAAQAILQHGGQFAVLLRNGFLRPLHAIARNV